MPRAPDWTPLANPGYQTLMQRWIAKLSPQAVGFRVTERLTGSHRCRRAIEQPDGRMMPAGTEAPFSFEATWGHPQLLRYFNPTSGDFLSAVIEGTVTASGLCQDAPMRGTVESRQIASGTVRYCFDFEVRGIVYRFEGQKRDLRPWNLHRTHLSCRGTISEATSGLAVSDASAAMRLSHLPKMLLSFRLRRPLGMD